MTKSTVVQVDPEILSCTPVFAGTRVPVETLLAYFERGRPRTEFLADFPTVTEQQAVAALEEAKEALLARAQPPTHSAAEFLDSSLEEDSKVQAASTPWSS